MLAGINHFWHTEKYLRIMPPYLPWHEELVAISGICEIILGVALLFPSIRRIAAWGIIALLIAVFPANVQMLINYWKDDHPWLWFAIVRVPLQPILIWWVYQFTKRSAYHV